MSEVNMIYYEKDYYAIPDAGAEKAYELLRQSLLMEKKVAIAKTVMGTNEKLLVLYPMKDGMIVKTLFYNDEIAAVPKQVPKMKLSEQEIEMARMLIQNMTEPFDATAYQDKNISPMLIAQMWEPFDDPEWIYELKLDGCRCIAYLEQDRVTLRNKRNMELLSRFIELKDIYKQVNDRCILDGELVVMVNGVPDFYELQKRTLLTSRTRIELGAKRLPASFVAYDCLQIGNKVLLDTWRV